MTHVSLRQALHACTSEHTNRSVSIMAGSTGRLSSEIFVFLHGFSQDGGVGGGGQIAKYIASLFHVPVEQPNLNQPSFNEFSVTNAIKVMDRLFDEKQSQHGEPIRMNLIGASMGELPDEPEEQHDGICSS